jgi:alpha-galactosidase
MAGISLHATAHAVTEADVHAAGRTGEGTVACPSSPEVSAVLTLQSGLPRIVSQVPRLATPVRLPFARKLPGPVTEWEVMTAEGKWGKEYKLDVSPLGADGFRYAQRLGRATSGRKAWWLLANRRTGQGLALQLAYMGNWTYEVVPQGQEIEVRLSTSPDGLEPFTTVQGLPVPGALVAEFTGHWDNGAQPIVRFVREKLLRDLAQNWPLVQYNNWYDTPGRLTQQKLLDSARVAADLGCELFTVDAGWYGKGLDANWERSLGDWEVNRDRLPDGIEAVAEAVRKAGMKFGLWFEIECAHPQSRLASAHPEWFLTDAAGRRLGRRDVLDFGKPEVVSHAKNVIDATMARYRLDYIKMDFNTDPTIENQGLKQEGDPLYRHYRGLAELWSYMRKQYPSLIIENCASGSLRQELTAAAFTDTHWVSDAIDNRSNLMMAFGATYLMPASICSHWTTKPSRHDGQMDLDAQFVATMMGHMGLSGAIVRWDQETREVARRRIAQYKRIRPILRDADVYHLTRQQAGAMQAALYVDEKTGRALLFAFQGGDAELAHSIRLRGLDPRKTYRVDGINDGTATCLFPGQALVSDGFNVAFTHKGAVVVVELTP